MKSLKKEHHLTQRSDITEANNEGENLETSFMGVTEPSKPNQANQTSNLWQKTTLSF